MHTFSQDQLNRTLDRFHHAFFSPSRTNRFADLIDTGHDAYAELTHALEEPDVEERIDALMTLGCIFETHGHTTAVLRTVVDHAKTIHGGLGPERHAALYAIGRARERSLIDSFLPLLDASSLHAVNVAAFLLGYARWREAVPQLLSVLARNDRRTVPAVIWALGQIGDPRALEVLLPMLRRGEHAEWILGALGEIGAPEALEDLVTKLTSDVTNTRLLTVSAIWAIVDHNRTPSVRRDWLEWLVPQLRLAAKDTFPPVAVLAMMMLAELGQQVSEPDLHVALAFLGTDAGLGRAEAFYVGRSRPS